MGILYIGKYAKFRCAALEFSSIYCVLKPMGILFRPGCLAYFVVGVLPLGWGLRA